MEVSKFTTAAAIHFFGGRKPGARAFQALFIAILLPLLASPSSFASAIADVPDPNTWGFDGIVYGIVRIDDVVYIGGTFTNLISPDGTTKLAAKRLAALDTYTGQPTSWRPAAEGTVNALEASADGTTIYAGGTFKNINGIRRSKFAAIGTDGSVLWSSDVKGTVLSLAVDGTIIYVGGNFTQVQGVNRSSLAAIQVPAPGGTHAILLPWAPTVTFTGGNPHVDSLAVASGSVVANGKFDQANGQFQPNQARFDALTGSLQTWTYHDAKGRDLVTDGINYYGAIAGGGGRAISWGPTGNLRWKKRCSGDAQAITLCAGQVIVGGHFGFLEGIEVSRLAALDPATGTLDTTWSPNPDPGIDRGVWALCGSEDKLYVGGAFDKMRDLKYRRFAQFSVVQPFAAIAPKTAAEIQETQAIDTEP